MKTLRDSTEIQEALSLLAGLSQTGAVLRAAKPAVPKAPRRAPRPRALRRAPDEMDADNNAALTPVEQLPFRDDRIQHLLGAMCRRAGFAGAVLADQEGLPLAAYHSPVTIEAAAACSSVLGEALIRAGELLDHPQANHLSLTINETEKVCLHTFAINGLPCQLLVMAAQATDERGEMLQCISQLTQLTSVFPTE